MRPLIGNSMVKRQMKEEGDHLGALVYEYRIKSEWSNYQPQVQRIINYTVDGSIEFQPERVIFGDMVDSNLAMYPPEGSTGRNPKDNLVKIR